MTLTSERWERRVHDEQAERLDILLARGPASETVTLTPSVVMSHVPERTISRIVKRGRRRPCHRSVEPGR